MSAGRPRVLVADDNGANRALLRSFLDRLGYDVELVEDGVKAVAAALRGGYAALLLDWQMPKMDGLAVARLVRSHEADRGVRTLIVAVTASAMPGDREKCLAAGMDDYLSKPIQLQDLRRVLGHWIAGEPPPGEAPAPPSEGIADAAVLAGLRVPAAGGALLLDLLIDLYLADGSRRVAAITEAVARGDARTVERQAHTLKGASANLSLSAVRGLCETIEARARAGETESLAGLVEKLGEAFAAAAERLKAERSPRPPDPGR